MWPRGIVAAGSFWYYSKEVDLQNPSFPATIHAQNKVHKCVVCVLVHACVCVCVQYKSYFYNYYRGWKNEE